MKFLSPYKFSMFKRRIQEEDIVLWFELQPHSFSDKVKFIVFLFLGIGKVNKLVHPFFD